MSNYTDYQYRAAPGFGSARITWAVQRLILLNGLVFAAQVALDPAVAAVLGSGFGRNAPGGFLTQLLGFQPDLFLRGMIWKPFTYQFLHFGLMHLFMNMLWLFFFGPDVERSLGTRHFYRFYLICGAAGVLANYVTFFSGGGSPSVIGASGAVMGVLVAFAMVDPQRQLYLFPIPTPLNARAIVLIVLAMNVFNGLTDPSGTMSVATHLGGMAVGFIYMKALPPVRAWWRGRRLHAAAARNGESADPVGEAVDNIFKFRGKDRDPF